MVLSVAVHWIIFLLVLIGFEWLNLSAYAVWALLVFSFTALSVLPYLRYRQEKWKEIHVVEPAPIHPDVPIV